MDRSTDKPTLRDPHDRSIVTHPPRTLSRGQQAQVYSLSLGNYLTRSRVVLRAVGGIGSLCVDSRASNDARLGEVVVDESEQREVRDGAGDAFSAAFEMIVTPAIFGLLGWFIDSRLGTFPVLTLLLVGFVLAYEVWKLFVRYSLEMDEALEERRAGYGKAAS